MGRGGAETLAARLLPRLDRWEHRVVYVRDGPIRPLLERSGIRCVPVRGTFRPADPTLPSRALAALRRERPALVVAQLWLGCLLGRLNRRRDTTPLITILHQDPAFDGWPRRALSRGVGLNEDAAVAVSATVADSVRRHFPVLAPRLRVIPNGIDVAAVRAEVQAHGISRARLGIGEDEFVALAVGRFDPVKNFPVLVEAASRLARSVPRFRLVIAGSGRGGGELTRLVARLGLADRVLVESNQPAVPYLAIADAFLQPSRTEGLSMALLEALAAGVPVIAAVPAGSADGHPVIQDGVTGVLAPPTPEGFAAAIEALGTRRDLADRLGAAGSAHVAARFALEATAAAYDGLFREVLADSPRREDRVE